MHMAFSRYATKPEEVVKDFEKLKLPDELKKFIENEKEVSRDLAKCYKLKDDEIVEYLMAHKQESDDSLINVPGVNRMKLLTSAIQDIEVSKIFVKKCYLFCKFSSDE